MFRFASSLASLTRCASPPESVGADCPRRTYPSPTSTSVFIWREMTGWFAKKSTASEIGISSTSAIFFPRKVMSSVSRLYRAPLQTSQGTYTSGRKCISILMFPSPEQASHRPPLTLKLNRPGKYPRTFDSGAAANSFRMLSNTPV